MRPHLIPPHPIPPHPRGVDGLISVFFDPDSVSRALRLTLDRAGVEQA